MEQLNSTGIKISYDDLGLGEPALLLMPGWCANRTVFADMAARCGAHRRTLVMDWRGHGQSGSARGDFGDAGLLEDVLAVIKGSGVGRIVPVALAHAGWIAIALRKTLGERVTRFVAMDWLIMDAPPPFLSALESMQTTEGWRGTVNQIFDSWLHGITNEKLVRFVREEMGAYGYEMWSRAAREISRSYREFGNPLKVLASLSPALPTLHLYAQPDDEGYLTAQKTFAKEHPWFHVTKLAAKSHFPMFEVPETIELEIEKFLS